MHPCRLLGRLKVAGAKAQSSAQATEGGCDGSHGGEQGNSPGDILSPIFTHLRWQLDDTGNVLKSPDDRRANSSAELQVNQWSGHQGGFTLSCNRVPRVQWGNICSSH